MNRWSDRTTGGPALRSQRAVPRHAAVPPAGRRGAAPLNTRRRIAARWWEWGLFGTVAAASVFLAHRGAQIGSLGAPSLHLGTWSGRELALPAGQLILVYAASWSAALAAVVLFPRRLSFRQSASLSIALAVLCRAALLPFPASDDVNRYLWEGRLVARGLSPYQHAPVAPDDPVADAFRTPEDPFWPRINHPEMRAIYPPLMLLLFAAVATVSYSTAAGKGVVVAFDVATVVLLLLLLRARRLDPRWALLYALNPVVLYAFAGEAHLDAVHVFLLTAAVCLYTCRRWPWMFVALGLAVQAKYVAAAAVPFFVRRDNLRHAWVGIVAAALPLLYFWPSDGSAVFHSLRRFGSEFAFNGSLHWALYALFGRVEPMLLLWPWLFAIVWGACLWRFHPERCGSPYRDPVPGVAATLGALLLLSPSVHFWYVSWIAPFLALRPTAPWVLLCLTIAFSFAARASSDFHLPLWAQAATWAPPLLLMAGRLAHTASRLRTRACWAVPTTVSVVIPVRGEARQIRACIDAVRADPSVLEVLVVDGGSSDASVAIARAAGATVIEHAAPFDAGGGRGGQIRAGLVRARGDVVVVIHADTRVSPHTCMEILDVLAHNPDVVGGAVGSVFPARGRFFRVLEIANAFRAGLLGIAFGDQVQFFRRAPIARDDLFPALPLMEDVELSLRLRRLGRVVFLWGDCRVSARRWQNGAGRRAILIVRLVAGYLLRRIAGPVDTVPLYRRYYASPASAASMRALPRPSTRPRLRLAPAKGLDRPVRRNPAAAARTPPGR